MQRHLLTVLFRVIGLVPFTWTHRIAYFAATWMIKCQSELARVSRINIERCFPDRSAAAQTQLVKDSLVHSILLLFELGRHLPTANSQRKPFTEVVGRELFDAAWSQQKGVILLAPHFGCWELLHRFTCWPEHAIALYDPPSSETFESLLTFSRELNGVEMFSTSRSGLKGFLRAAREPTLVLVLPDQVPDYQTKSIKSHFMGEQVMTMALVHRLVKKYRKPILMAAVERRIENGQPKYVFHFQAPDEAIASDDEALHADALNAAVERVVEIAPEQYQWSYKRFKRAEDKARNIYRRQ